MHHPFKKGDWVNIDNSYGMVEDLGWITTSHA
jgi:small-conductance mechanosensitive channel